MDLHMYKAQLDALAAMSNHYGADPELVLAGGGNTSYKTEKNLWIKGSGTSLATIRGSDFVVMEREKLANMWNAQYPAEEAAREAAVLEDMMNARVAGETRRPSVETLLHDLFPQSYILHVHPAIVNGITCSVEGQAAMKRLFPEAVWVEACKPGYILALECKNKMAAYQATYGRDCNLLFLQNHGIFFAADTVAGIDELAHRVMRALKEASANRPDLSEATVDREKAEAIRSELAALYGGEASFMTCPEILGYDPATKSLSPDHIVYAKAKQLAVSPEDNLKARFEAFTAENGYKPKIIFVAGLGMFSCGASKSEADTALAVMLDAIKVVAYAKNFGGVSPMPEFLIDFIVNWEVESYRAKVSGAK